MAISRRQAMSTSVLNLLWLLLGKDWHGSGLVKFSTITNETQMILSLQPHEADVKMCLKSTCRAQKLVLGMSLFIHYFYPHYLEQCFILTRLIQHCFNSAYVPLAQSYNLCLRKLSGITGDLKYFENRSMHKLISYHNSDFAGKWDVMRSLKCFSLDGEIIL